MSSNPPNGISILVVDDDVDTLALVGLILRRQGFQVDFASLGEVALEKLKTNRYEAMITDLMMPGMDGRELAAAIRSGKTLPYDTSRSIAIIVCTAKQSFELIGFDLSELDGFLPKPFSINEIAETIYQAIEHRRNVNSRLDGK